MEITRRKAGTELEIKLDGRLDASWSELVSSALAESIRSGEHHLALDMELVPYISSAGIRVLMQAYKQLRAIGGVFRVIRPSESVRSTLELSGLSMLIAEAKPSPAGEERAAEDNRVSAAGIPLELYNHAGSGKISGRLVGAPGCRAGAAAELLALSIDEAVIAVGFGALGSRRSERFGEFLAAAGAACSLDGETSAKTDYLLKQENFVPCAQLAAGIAGRGEMRLQFGFDGEQPLSALAGAAMELTGGSACALAVIAETACLVGAALRKWEEGDLLSFPAVKDSISFTVEPAHIDTVTLLAGFAALDGDPCAGHMKPLACGGKVFAHIHAAVFPYAPLPKGRLDLAESVGKLFAGQAPEGILHLLNDWRDCIGAGESRFIRGSCWCAPFELEE